MRRAMSAANEVLRVVPLPGLLASRAVWTRPGQVYLFVGDPFVRREALTYY